MPPSILDQFAVRQNLNLRQPKTNVKRHGGRFLRRVKLLVFMGIGEESGIHVDGTDSPAGSPN